MHTAHLARRGLVLLVAAATLAACAEGSAPRQGSISLEPTGSEGAVPQPMGPTINWELPYGEYSKDFDSVKAAGATLPFEPVVPSFAVPDVIQVTPEGTSSDNATIAMVFHLADEGTVLLEEKRAGEVSADDLAEFAASYKDETAAPAPGDDQSSSPAPGFSMVSLRSGEALLIQDRGIGRLTWIENGLRFDLMGERITPSQVAELAEAL